MNFKTIILAGTALAGLGTGGAAEAASCLGHFNFTGSIETCTVAETGFYEITVNGAAGGLMPNFVTGHAVPGGAGGQVSGMLTFQAGTTFQLLVGEQGGFDDDNGGVGGGGGGGSFVTINDNEPLLVAGGGGGAGVYDRGGDVGIEAAGDGHGGHGAQGYGAGGGGFLTDGGAGYYFSDTFFNTGGKSFLDGGAAGISIASPSERAGADGGFGGGGAGGTGGGGGGGGYSGGNGGTLTVSAFGGTSFVSSRFVSSSMSSDVNYADGSIIIRRVEDLPPTPVPLPATGGLIGIGLASLAAIRASRSRKKT